jgi:endonuclease YncB( thermonuclease family)
MLGVMHSKHISLFFTSSDPLRVFLVLLLLLVASACYPDRGQRRNSNSGDPNSRHDPQRPSPAGMPSQESESDSEDPETSSDEIVIIPKELTARVVGVHDGDTITVLDRTNRQHKIRLSGIDAPELGQDFSQASKKYLSSLVFGQDVMIEHDKVDRWGRIVGKVLVGGRDVNLEMVEAGLAWHFKRYEKEQSQADRIAYADAERRARDAKKGIWSLADPVPPWERRR